MFLYNIQYNNYTINYTCIRVCVHNWGQRSLEVFLYLAASEQTAFYSLFLELQIGMQTVRGVPNTRKRRAVNAVHIPTEFNGEFAITSSRGTPNVTSRIQVKLNSIARYWERALFVLARAVVINS